MVKMDNNRGFVSDFSRFPQSNQFSQKVNGQPVSKKPKLDIGRHENLSGSSSNRASKQNGDIYDDLWGDEPDGAIIEKINFDETLALSQMPEPVMEGPHSVLSRTGSSMVGQGTSRTVQSSNAVLNSGNNNKPGFVSNKGILTNFMKNSPRVPLRRTASSGWPSTSSFSPHPSNVANSFVKKLNDGNSIQSDFEQLQIENENLKDELTRKTGEANLVRSKLVSTQQELTKHRKEFMDKIDAIKLEAEKNNARLSKEISSLKGQLDVKVMEMETAERRTQHLNSMNRLHPESPNNRFQSTMRSAFSPARVSDKQGIRDDHLMCGRSQIRAKSHTVTFELLQQIITPELLKPAQPEATIVESVRTITNPGLFSGPVRQAQNTASGHSSKSVFVTASTGSGFKEVLPTLKTQLSVSCPSLEPCSLSLLSSRLLDVNSDNAHHIISQVIGTCCQILTDQLHQLNSAVSAQSRYLEREREVLHCGHKNLILSEDYNLLCSKELYNNERGICTRRALALLSLLVEISDFAALQILPSSDGSDQKRRDSIEMLTESNSPHEFHMMLTIVKDIVCQIEKQRRTLMFEGVLAAVMALVRSLLQTELTLSQQSQDLIVHILRGVVFSRPSSLVIHKIVQVLLAAAKYPEITDNMCNNSVKKTFLENTHHSIITFTPDTCILQVLCTLIQIVETPKKHILSDIFTSWVLTLFYGSQRSPRWLFSVPSQTSCQCRPLVTRLTFTLLGKACCVYPSVSDISDEKKLIEKLLTRGILLVCTLLYHDEHFGANVDPASVGCYELFLHSMNTFNVDLNKSCREILESLCKQEALRQPMNISEGQSSQLLALLSSSRSQNEDVLKYLETC